ncbi:MAG: hypothetical protein HYV95_11815 [Opitutae bacterium]|nr:hypothetical protein [Opitutae bacterium]
MNLRAHPPRLAGARWATFRLVLGLLPAVATSAPSMAPEIAGSAASRPYLTVAGAAPLRFEEPTPPPPPDHMIRPAAGAPPQPTAPDTATTSESEPTKEAAKSLATGTPAPADTTSPETTQPAPKGKTPPPAILPDDTRPRVRPEDFLPFFQFPGSAANPNDVTLVPTPPAPGQQPPSSATYRQQ